MPRLFLHLVFILFHFACSMQWSGIGEGVGRNENERLMSLIQSVLFSLAAFTFTTNFKQTSPVAHLLPSWSGLLTSPFSTVGQVVTVMKMHSEHVTLESSERRKRGLADVDKRKEYRKAHGLEPDDGEAEADAAAADDNSPTNDTAGGSVVAADAAGAGAVNEDGSERRRRPIKKWFGIW